MKIHSQPEQMGGVWANAAAVRHSPHEFTIDFLRCEFGDDGRVTSGILVQRVNMSPLFVSQLITALQENWSKYADKAMPKELFDDIVIDPHGHHDDNPDDDNADHDSTADDSTADDSTADDSTADDSTADDSTGDDSTGDDGGDHVSPADEDGGDHP